MSEAATFQGSPDSLASGLSPGGTNASEGTRTSLSGHGGTSPTLPSLKPEPSSDASSTFAIPRTDKPRPHVCNTCGRSFARLEHLKRHERSHTKEKPFECPECTRCFARRDLLLRHQQKLHMTGATTARSKPRRESTSGVNTSARVRKSSVASNAGGASGGNASMRPRANTISHVDASGIGFLNPASRPNEDVDNGSAHHFNMMRGMGNFNLAGMSTGIGGHGNPQGLPRLATQGLGLDLDNDLRTAPPGSMMDTGFDVDQMFSGGTTINPAQLHLDDSVGSAASPFNKHFPPFHSTQTLMEEDENFDWMRGFNAQMNFNPTHDEAAVESSPSAMSNDGAGGMSEQAFQGSGNRGHQNNTNNVWQPNLITPQGLPPNAQGSDVNNGMFTDFGNPGDTISPESLHGQNGVEGMYPEPQQAHPLSPNSPMSGMPYQMQAPMTFSSDGGSISSTSATGSARRSSATSTATDSISEVTRQALLISLSQHSVFGHGQRKYSQPTISSPLSPRESSKNTGNRASLPSTGDLQRYVNSYIRYFHPHFPFLHIATLSFDAPAYTSNLRPANSSGGFNTGGIVGGGGCLILAMAAIGALYESDRAASKDLFESAKKMIQLYLEERRKADMANSATNRSGSDYAAQNTPLWLVQSMLLNVVYGHNCGDKIAGDIASTHCTALVSLARAADLIKPLPNARVADELYLEGQQFGSGREVNMGEGVHFQNPYNLDSNNFEDEQITWHRWIVAEERKRTLFAIFHLSSLLVSGYNHPPALMNSEIQLDLPCEEDLWAAETATAWSLKGGLQAAEHQSTPFATALSTLLTASQNQADHGFTYHQPFGSGIPLSDLPASNLRPSTFGCLVLINALHNYIWETRQRHSGRKWTIQETESMHAHIEPALRAWQSAWASNPTHSLERPNPSGFGPLSADSIPLLDLAYVRLFVNLGSSKEAFWAREFDVMAEELAKGSEFVQHAEYAENLGGSSSNGSRNSPGSGGLNDDRNTKMETSEDTLTVPPAPTPEQLNQSSKRERHLRRAAFYAADSMTMSHKLGVTFADFTSRELPIQSALCTFDCAQVLAEWVATVQERIGRYLGILGRDDIDFSQVPAIMLLEDEDCKLLEKISDILAKAEAKMTFEISSMGSSAAMAATNSLPSVSNWGLGSKILMVTAFMLQRAAVWPVTSVMAHGLEIQSAHMNKRAENSTGVSR